MRQREDGEGERKQCSMQSVTASAGMCYIVLWCHYLMMTYFLVWSHILTVQSAPHDANTFWWKGFQQMACTAM